MRHWSVDLGTCETFAFSLIDLATALHVIDETPAREIEANAERFLKMLQKL